MTSDAPGRRRILAALFVSGMAGLMHEVVWAKYLIDLMGNTARSNTVVLAVFMGGLAVGAVLFGRRIDAWGRPLLAYALLEVAIGVYCLLLPFLIGLAGAGYELLAASYFESPGLKLFLRFALSITVVAPPAVLMGGTLPILARHLVADVSETRRQVASLYALNNLGAVFGSGLAGFATLPLFGIVPSLALAALGNFAAAALVWGLPRRVERGGVPEPAAPEEGPTYGRAQYRATLVALALSGFAAMGYEIVFLRLIALSFGSSTYSFTVMLMCFITGLGVGSFLLTVARVRRPLWWLGASQLAVVVALVAVLPLVERWPFYIGHLRVALQEAPAGFELFQLGKAGLCLAVLLVPTVCIGVTFPLVAQVQARSVAHIGGVVGSTYAWNTVGNVLGTVITALVLIPMVGVRGSFELNLALSVAAGVLILAVASETRVPLRAGAGAVTLLALLGYVALGRGWPDSINMATNHLRMRSPEEAALVDSFGAWRARFVVDPDALAQATFGHSVPKYPELYFEEDANITVLAYRENDGGVELFVNGKGDASTRIGDLVNQVLLGHVPAFVALDVDTSLVIGHGSGITSGSSLRHPQRHMDIVEISRGVMEADYLFAGSNHGVLADPRVAVYLDDARTFLRTVPRSYDTIVSVPSNPWIAGIGSLFSREFFRDARERLQPGGVMCMWFHQYEQDDRGCQLVLRTLGSVFDHVILFHSFLSDVLAIASVEPIEPDFAAMEARFEEPGVRSDLARIGILNLATLLAHHAVSPSRFEGLKGEGPLNTDGHQRLQYMAPRYYFRGTTASLVTEYDGFGPGSDGLTDGWLDRYIAWRAEQGQPVSRAELASAVHVLGFNLRDEEHRLVRHARRRLEQAAPASGAVAGAARGGVPELATLDFFEAYSRGQQAALAGDDEAAVVLYRRALELQPRADVALEEADALERLERWSEAADALDPLVRAEGSNAALALRLARDRRAAGDLERSAMALAPWVERGNVQALTLMGELRRDEGRGDEARALFDRALAAEPRDVGSVVRLAELLGEDELGRARAIEALDGLLERYPRLREARELRERLAGEADG